MAGRLSTTSTTRTHPATVSISGAPRSPTRPFDSRAPKFPRPSQAAPIDSAASPPLPSGPRRHELHLIRAARPVDGGGRRIAARPEAGEGRGLRRVPLRPQLRHPRQKPSPRLPLLPVRRLRQLHGREEQQACGAVRSRRLNLRRGRRRVVLGRLHLRRRLHHPF